MTSFLDGVLACPVRNTGAKNAKSVAFVNPERPTANEKRCCAVNSISSTPVQTPEPVSAAFKKIQSLRGEWEGNDEHGGAASTNFKLVVAGTTVMESLVAGGMEEMLTLYTIDGDGIALVHYCPTDNQPRMRATPRSGDVKELVFQFAGAGNLPTLSMGTRAQAGYAPGR